MASLSCAVSALAARPVVSAARRSACPAARAPAPVRVGARSAQTARGKNVVAAAFDPYNPQFSYPEDVVQDPARFQHPNPEFIAETLEQFPDAGVADVEQALVLLLEGGYIILDIRSERLRDVGAVKGTTNVAWTVDKKRFVDGKMVVDSTPNPNWLQEFKKKVPNTETKIMVMDMDGRTTAIECLEFLFENGYENIVGIKGGFKMWFRTFDANLRRRVFGEYQENYGSYDQLGSGDSCGIHSSGAGFQNQDRMSGDFWDNF